MNGLAWSVARYRFPRSRASAWRSLVGIVLLVGMIGGVGLAALAGALATEGSYQSLLAQSNPSSLTLQFYAPISTSLFERLPGVRHVGADLFSTNAFAMSTSGAPILAAAQANNLAAPITGLGGEYFSQDRVSVVAGRRADPRDAGEFMATAEAERLLHWHLGQRILMGFYTNNQTGNPKFGSASLRPEIERVETLVATIVFNDAVVLDSVDEYPTWWLFTPAAAVPSLLSGPQYVQYHFQLSRGFSVAAVEREIIAALPAHQTYSFNESSVATGDVDRSLRPEALALGVFGLLAAASALLIGIQLVARRVRLVRPDAQVLRALGAGRTALVIDASLGPVIAGVVGSVLAGVVATLLSPFTLVGPVRPLLPGGLRFNAGVVVTGASVLAVLLVVAAAALGWWWAPGRRAASVERVGGDSRVARAAGNAGLPASAVAGLHFAFESGRGRRGVPVRTVLVGVALAVALIGTTLTFASGLTTLVSHPSLYGWNWNYALFTDEAVPPDSVSVLEHSPLVAASSGITFGDIQIDGVTEPAMIVASNSRVSAPILSGHGVRAVGQIVFGAATLAQLHKRVGETVLVSYGDKRDFPAYVPPKRLTIVGTATLPSIGGTQTLHVSMGVGAIIDMGLETKALIKAQAEQQPLPGKKMVLVRLRSGVSRAQGLALMNRAASAGNKQYASLPNGEGGGLSVSVLGVQYPAEIINYQTIGDTPLLLALAFALGVTVAFGLTIAASVRRRRHDLALLKTLGFTRRQLGACISWQASVSVLAGLIVGIPLGILLGRELWILFARQIYAVPLATVPTVPLVLLAVAALALANLVAAIPGWTAARTSVALALRAE